MIQQMNTQKILLFDIETSPNVGYCWGKWEQNIVEFLKESHLLSFSWKFKGDKKVKALSLPDFKLYKKDPENDIELVKELHKLFNEADILVAHNGNNFDVKMANMFFLKNGLEPIDEKKYFDTKLAAKSKFRFNSNKLDDIGHYLGLGRKINTGGFELWKDCLAGDKKAWAHMVKYNKQDVLLLEKVYDKISPWCKHPEVHINEGVCPVCGSKDIIQKGFRYLATGSKKQLFKCKSCTRRFMGKIIKK